MPQELNDKQVFKLALFGVSASLFLTPNLNAIATNETPTIRNRATANPQFLIAQQNRTRRIEFARGTNSATVEDAVVRGTRDTYLVNARAGQTMTVSITSTEENAVFDIIAPNRRTLKQEATSFTGKLPARGDYRIVVGGRRGNATYNLQVTIR